MEEKRGNYLSEVANFLVCIRFTRLLETVIFIFLYFSHVLTPKRTFKNSKYSKNNELLLTPNM